MKTKFLLVYGYFIPLAASALVSILPALIQIVSYADISNYFSNNLEVLLAFLAVIVAVTYPFQTSIIHEDNPHVLAVLAKSNVRSVFVRASIFQAVLIVCLTLLVLILPVIQSSSPIKGWIQLFASAMIAFEAIALISNGRAYGNIRERIITATNKISEKSS